jgi:CopG family transcriptional regulator, nickel-responsive regulator
LVRESSSRPAGQVAASLTVVYDHHAGLLEEKLTERQHSHSSIVLSVLHIHLDHGNCLEILALRGAAAGLRQFAGRLSAVEGMKRAQLVISGTGDTL